MTGEKLGDQGELVLLHAGVQPHELASKVAPRLTEIVDDAIAAGKAIGSDPAYEGNPGKWSDALTSWFGRRAERLEVELPGKGRELANLIRRSMTKVQTMQWQLQQETRARFGKLTGRPWTRMLPDPHKWGCETLFDVAKGVRSVTEDGRLEFGTKLRSGIVKIEEVHKPQSN